MTNFKDFFKKETPQPKTPSTNSVRGSFMCQECTEMVNVAYIVASEGKLVWLCSEGHKSSVAWV